MENFKIGETVIALNTMQAKYFQPRIKGNSYQVKDIMYCQKCGIQAINIGYKIEEDATGYTRCDCGGRQLDNGLKWTHSHNFCRPSELELLIREAEQKEKYEKAHELFEIQQSLLIEK